MVEKIIARTIVVAVLAYTAAFLIQNFLLQPFFVWGQSMEPTFQNYNHILVDKLIYRIREPKRGEIVVFYSREGASVPGVKRIIGLPGEKIKVYGGKVYINDQELLENHYLSDGVFTNDDVEMTLGGGEYFVLGDNRLHSHDSRRGGAVVKDQIVGRVVLRVLPLRKFGIIENPF